MNTPRLLGSLLSIAAIFCAQAQLRAQNETSTEDRTIRIPLEPQLSPDGQTVAFRWHRDIWTVPSSGGTALRLTTNAATDKSPCWSPDGKTIAFLSTRSGNTQIHWVSASGGAPRQLTIDSDSKQILGFTQKGDALVIMRRTDKSFFAMEANRVFTLPLEGQATETMLMDVGCSDASLSPDASKLLFTRGRSQTWRKGYTGPAADQIWVADLASQPATLTRITKDQPRYQNIVEREPLWAPNGEGFYFTSEATGTFDLYFKNLDDTGSKQITDLRRLDGSDDGVTDTSLSADGSRILFRRRFDLFTYDVASKTMNKLEIQASGDSLASAIERRKVTGANSVAFTKDGKQMAFVAGHDLYVMDRILKEPKRITEDIAIESNLVFSNDGKQLYFTSERNGEVDIWRTSCPNEDGIWWLCDDFELESVTDDKAVESSLKLSPTGKHIGYTKGTDLFVMDADGSDHRRLIKSWNAPRFDWSPDGKWVTYSIQDDEFNNDVFVLPLDGTRAAFNLSRHPDNDSSPVWSRDGNRIAWTARRDGDESDIYYVDLSKGTEEETSRDRKMKKALAAMKKGSKGKTKPASAKKGDAKAKSETKNEVKKSDKKKDSSKTNFTIDFDGIHERVHRIRITDSRESGLIWSPDGKKLAFSATVSGQRGIYTVTFPDAITPKKIASSGLMSARWLKEGNQIVGLKGPSFGGGYRFTSSGFSMAPASMSAAGKITTFSFSILESRDWREIRKTAFDQGWRAMRDGFYDSGMNNRKWDAVRSKYRKVAGQLIGMDEFSAMMNMMLGELNASHMGHRGGTDPLPRAASNSWAPKTYKLGLRFDRTDDGKGLLVAKVIPGSPCSLTRSKVEAGERIQAIDGKPVATDTNLYPIMTLNAARDMVLTVSDEEGNERKVTVRPTSSVSGLLYDEYVLNNRSIVETMSDGNLGYAHIRGMNMSSFRQLEEDLYHAGAGKDGLIIDVRYNGGGSTADHVLTVLSQPAHAVTVPRNGGEGYPQDRKIYASWTKPVIIMCNEFSFSNAEILAHAVKSIGRGRVVGMRSAGGVISTGARGLMDGSMVRMPFRGWYVKPTGEDMELNGCEPDITLWNKPDGADDQLQKAVEALAEDCAQLMPTAKPVPASHKR